MKVIPCLALCSLLAGCATSSPQMPESNYQKFSGFIGFLQKCFEQEYIGPQMYADSKNALSYTLSTWSYDQFKLSNMINQAYSNTYANKQDCRQIEANAYQLIANANQHNANVKANQQSSQQAWDNALKELNKNKPVYCNTIGTMTICN